MNLAKIVVVVVVAVVVDVVVIGGKLIESSFNFDGNFKKSIKIPMLYVGETADGCQPKCDFEPRQELSNKDIS